MNFGEVRRAQLAKSTPLTYTLWSWDLFRSFKFCSDAKEGVGCGKQWEAVPRLFIPSKTATLVPEFAVEDLSLDRTATLVRAFAVKDLPLGRTHDIPLASTPVVSWLSYSPLDPRFAGSNPAGVDEFFFRA